MGERRAAEIKPLEIEAWFEALTVQPFGKQKYPLSWATIAKLKSTMSQVFRHAQRHELIAAAIGGDGRPTNPVILARSPDGVMGKRAIELGNDAFECGTQAAHLVAPVLALPALLDRAEYGAAHLLAPTTLFG